MVSGGLRKGTEVGNESHGKTSLSLASYIRTLTEEQDNKTGWMNLDEWPESIAIPWRTNLSMCHPSEDQWVIFKHKS